jgi:L-ascorbate metabolism protein UlaG (beta-lactamase superfamily)
MRRLTRRALGILAAALGGAEVLSLSGGFDHREAPLPTAREQVRAALSEEKRSVIHVGHSTHVVCLGGERFLTDPWFNDPAFGALRHARGPACGIEDLAACTSILVSHEHPDHADLVALDRFSTKSKVSVLVGTAPLARKIRALGYANVHVLVPWESFRVGAVVVHAVRGVHDVPEIGFVLEGPDGSVYFAGDTAYHEDLPAIAERYRPRLAILPVDGLRLRGASAGTMGADDAVRAARVLGVGSVMVSHTESAFTDPLAEHVLTASVPGGVERFRAAMAAALPKVRCEAPAPGGVVALG